MIMVMPAPLPPMDTFADLNDGIAASIRTLITTPTLQPTELTGMGLGGKGVYNLSEIGLRSNLDPNSAAVTGTAGVPGAENGLSGGSMITSALDNTPISTDMAVGLALPAGARAHALFRDWGDTQGDGDGGYETGAIVVENHEAATLHDWDGDLAGRFANAAFTVPGVTVASGTPYSFTVDRLGADGTPGTDAVMDTVAFEVATGMGITPGGEGSYVNANAASPGALAITVTSADDGAFRAVSGRFLGVYGTFTCGTTDCALSRENGTDNFTLGTGNWQFTPAPGSTVWVPDQDWMAYGAWMTTPDNTSGPHRIGTFYNGHDPYDAGTNFTVGDDAGLHGTAEYSGGATGIYVDDMASGLFTATATLMVNFDVDGDGTADDGDYSISGMIDDFRGTNGVFLGTDTADTPNDPNAGGENDWTVMLDSSTLADIATASDTSGSADGLPWTGTWLGTLFGPATNADGDSIAPSGVAGEFSASTTAIGTDVAAGNTAVVGAFGATRVDE
ncbi:MAG: hypothetical protein OXO52_11975 [Rhodospirillales bacterium]|nr:hypothetical protein [Rhodospirillales bacterium]